MKLLVDMNLSPEWVPYLRAHGFEAVHWMGLGAPNASDTAIMGWARNNAHIVLTHDLDFGILLAHSRDGGPSVVQVRTQDVTPDQLGPVLTAALREHCGALTTGALVTIDPGRSRVRILPLKT